MMRFAHRRPWLLTGVLAVLALAACEQPGLDRRDAEFSRQLNAEGFAVIEVTAERAVFTARGQRIVVEPPPGYCLDGDSVAVTRHAAFALIADCMPDHQAKLENGAGASHAGGITLPRVFPGILTVSISGEPAYGWETGALDAFEELIGTEAGLKLLGRGHSPAPGTIIATRRIGGALYVLIEEPATDQTSILAPRFWRAFININGRLVLVTVSSFSDRPMAEDSMMGFLTQQMTRLRQANGLRINREEDEIARLMAVSLGSAQGIPTAHGAARPMVALGQVEPVPVPRPRGWAASARPASSGPAPTRSAPAPRRPG